MLSSITSLAGTRRAAFYSTGRVVYLFWRVWLHARVCVPGIRTSEWSREGFHRFPESRVRNYISCRRHLNPWKTNTTNHLKNIHRNVKTLCSLLRGGKWCFNLTTNKFQKSYLESRIAIFSSSNFFLKTPSSSKAARFGEFSIKCCWDPSPRAADILGNPLPWLTAIAVEKKPQPRLHGHWIHLNFYGVIGAICLRWTGLRASITRVLESRPIKSHSIFPAFHHSFTFHAATFGKWLTDFRYNRLFMRSS